MPRAKGLTPDQQRFVDEYLKDLNQVQAYRRAFPGTSYTSASNQSSRMMKRVEVKAEITAALADLRERSREDATAALRELGLLATSRITDVVDVSDPDRPRLKDPKDVPPEAWAAVQEISRTAHGVKVKMHSKPAALDKVLARLGLTREITPLDALLLSLPGDLREAVRRALLAALPGGGGPAGGGGDGAAG